MSLLNQILQWSETLPSWQRDACRRLFINESDLTPDDYLELYSLVLKENGIAVENCPKPTPLLSEHLPIQSAENQTVSLIALRNLENVNLIPNSQTLNFSETGITVIYGGNGSGKSGYARVIKRACRARDQSELIHPNAHDPSVTNKVPKANFDIKIGDAITEVAWSRDNTPPDHLSLVTVFDSRCARSYINAEQDVAYLPYGLDIVESLANVVLPKLSSTLEADISNINVSTLPFEHLCNDTEAGKAVRSLSPKSNADSIKALGTLTENEVKQISELDSALKENDPLAKAHEHRLCAMRLKSYAQKIALPLKWVNIEAVNKLRKINDEKLEAEEAEKRAADALREGESLLQGTGEAVWKLLFNAAKRYSAEVSHVGHPFPPSDDNSACPLCQEILPEAAINRLKRFDHYVQNDVAQAVETARQIVISAKSKIEYADIVITPDTALSDELGTLDSSILQVINEYQTSLENRRTAMLECLTSSKWEDIPELTSSPYKALRKLAAQQLRSHKRLLKAADEKNRKNLEFELSELLAKQELAKSLDAVIDLLERMKKKAALEKCRPSLKTRQISDQSKKFASAAVTDELKKALNMEFTELGVGHIKAKFKERTDKGKMYHQLLLDLPTSRKVEDILSEGEQRAIALSSFFAELALSNHYCGIVLDDPVSSLDHWRRRNVARRLVKEAKQRQVIVFTHDTSFLGQLCDEIEEAGITSFKSYLEWQGSNPGYVNHGLPWDQQGYKARIDSLEKAQSSLAKRWPIYPNQDETREMRNEYDRLRATLERVIQDVVFNGVVKRYRDWIKVDSLKSVVGFNQNEFEIIDNLHKRCSDVITAHDQSGDKCASVPTAQDLGKDINVLKSLVQTIQNRRKK